MDLNCDGNKKTGNQKNTFSADEMLMLSGIQHYSFCPRQWALIHIEQKWIENVYTVEGQFMHERVEDPFFSESRRDTEIIRSVYLVSNSLGLYGKADVIEFIRAGQSDMNSIILPGKADRWKPIPVEYKRGKPKPDVCDEVQLCAQAMCLEEMHQISIRNGFIYYGKTRHRHNVVFTEKLRNLVNHYALEMHRIFKEGITPPPEPKPGCRSCSLYDICLPEPLSQKMNAHQYNESMLNADI